MNLCASSLVDAHVEQNAAGVLIHSCADVVDGRALLT